MLGRHQVLLCNHHLCVLRAGFFDALNSLHECLGLLCYGSIDLLAHLLEKNREVLVDSHVHFVKFFLLRVQVGLAGSCRHNDLLLACGALRYLGRCGHGLLEASEMSGLLL